MSMNAEPDDLTEGWPDEPGNERLARFADGLRASLPMLPEAALGRVKERVRREIAVRRRRRIVMLAGAGLAAALLLGAVWLGWPLGFAPSPSHLPGPTNPEPEASARVDDHFTVEFAAPQASAGLNRPPIHFEEYQSLFTN